MSGHGATLKRLVFSFLIVVAVGFSGAAVAAPVKSDLTEAEIVAARTAVPPGETAHVALRFKHKPGWHSYWKNPGDSGLPIKVEWTLPEGWRAGAIQWPTPERERVGPLVNYGYSGEFLLPVDITVPADAKVGSSYRLKANAAWLTCEKVCVPEQATLTLDLAIGGGGPDRRWSALFEVARREIPKPSPWVATVSGGPDRLTVFVAAKGLSADRLKDVYFYPVDGNAIEHAAKQTLRVSTEGFSLDIPRGIDKGKPIKALDGVLAVVEKIGDGSEVRQTFDIRADLGTGAASGGTAMPVAVAEIGIVQAALFAVLGGLILNLMPCVFPILFMKVLAIAGLGSAARHEVRIHGLAYAAGVIATFVLLAGALFALRAGGEAIGWGFQLQSPIVILLLAYLMAAIGFNLAGVFDVSVSGNLGQTLTGRGGTLGAFLTGVLAVIVATPCTAPFMGAALGVAMVQPPAVGIGVFMALGLGMALPFLAFSLAPGLARYLPKPGPWMVRFKQVLAFPMFATAAWLVWVLSRQVGSDGVIAALGGILLIAFAGWLWGIAGDGRGRTLRRAAAFVLLIAALGLAKLPGDAPQAAPAAITPAGSAVEWSKFEVGLIDQARREGRPVLVNMTAAWCITCLVNEKTALSSQRIADALKEKNALPLKGDWTNRDPEITKYLSSFGRNGVPIYVLYSPDPAAAPSVLPQLLTESMVMDALAKL